MRKLQKIVAASSVEAEYIALSKCVRKGLRIRKAIRDFLFELSTMGVRCDSLGVIALFDDKKMNEFTMYVAACYYLVRDYPKKMLVPMSYVLTQSKIADRMIDPSRRLKSEANVHMYGLQTRSI